LEQSQASLKLSNSASDCSDVYGRCDVLFQNDWCNALAAIFIPSILTLFMYLVVFLIHVYSIWMALIVGSLGKCFDLGDG
jgi:hypothetical protein